MKTYSILLSLIFAACCSAALAQQSPQTTYQQQLPQLRLTPERTLHLISPEPISYVDISSSEIIGDLPLDNVLRLKLQPDSLSRTPAAGILDHSLPANLGTISIIGETYIAQYSLQRSAHDVHAPLPTRVNITPEVMAPLELTGISLSRAQMKEKALQLISRRPGQATRKHKDMGITMRVNALHSAGEYIFMDLSISSDSNLPYDPDELRFFIEDKKITKATNVQSIEILPVFSLYPLQPFKRSFRNIYVLKKVSFPGSKVLKISLSEQQLSGRALELKIKYRDLLNADTI